MEIAAFFSHVLYGENTLATIGDISISADVASVTVEYSRNISAKFVYTTSTDLDSHAWEWQSVNVDIVDGVCSYALPAGVSAYLFEFSMMQTFGQSTEIVIVDKTVNYQ